MNALQRLIADYLNDNPSESYASIGRRGGLSKSTVQSAATTEVRRQTPHPATVEGLARGMSMPVERVAAAAGDSAGYRGFTPQEMDTEEGRIVVAAWHELTEERKRELARRARFLLMEQQESDGDR